MMELMRYIHRMLKDAEQYIDSTSAQRDITPAQSFYMGKELAYNEILDFLRKQGNKERGKRNVKQ